MQGADLDPATAANYPHSVTNGFYAPDVPRQGDGSPFEVKFTPMQLPRRCQKPIHRLLHTIHQDRSFPFWEVARMKTDVTNITDHELGE
jgi:hypothetical protein